MFVWNAIDYFLCLMKMFSYFNMQLSYKAEVK